MKEHSFPGPDPHPDPVADRHDRRHPVPLPFTAQWAYELAFPCDPRGPGVARVTVRAVLDAHGLGELAEQAVLLTCELATNSVRHAKGPAGVRLDWLYPVLRGSVWDPAPELSARCRPVPVPVPDLEADGGRGLFLLDALADRWGGCAVGEGAFGSGGKSLWFELILPGHEPPPAALAA